MKNIFKYKVFFVNKHNINLTIIKFVFIFGSYFENFTLYFFFQTFSRTYCPLFKKKKSSI